MAEMVVALLLAGLIIGSTKSGRSLSRGVWKASEGHRRRAAGFGARQASRAGSAARGAGRKVGDKAQARWAARTGTAAPTSLVSRTPPVPSTPPPQQQPKRDSPAPAPQQPDTPTTEENTMSATPEMESPSSDGELLATLYAAAQTIRSHAAATEEFESELTRLGLDRSVVADVQNAAGALADAADSLARSGARFEEVYDEVREVARKGMHFRGEDAA